MRIEYQELKIGQIFSHFIKDFEMKPGEEIYDHESTYDPHTGKVIIKLYISKKLK